MLEAGVVVGLDGDAIVWHCPVGRHSALLPDSRDLWQHIWDNRHNVVGFAHTHPGSGDPVPSNTDLTTFAAVEAALGKRLVWWIASSNRVWVFCWTGPDRLDYDGFESESETKWLEELRRLSEIDTGKK